MRSLLRDAVYRRLGDAIVDGTFLPGSSSRTASWPHGWESAAPSVRAAVETVLDQFGPLVCRAERLRFSADGHASVELHARLIELIAAGDAQAAASVAFHTWHTLPADAGDTAG